VFVCFWFLNYLFFNFQIKIFILFFFFKMFFFFFFFFFFLGESLLMGITNFLSSLGK
jgi:hypothetical protein